YVSPPARLRGIRGGAAHAAACRAIWARRSHQRDRARRLYAADLPLAAALQPFLPDLSDRLGQHHALAHAAAWLHRHRTLAALEWPDSPDTQRPGGDHARSAVRGYLADRLY